MANFVEQRVRLGLLAAGIACGLSGCSDRVLPAYHFHLLDNSTSGSPFSRAHFAAQGPFQVTTECSLFSSYPKIAEAGVLLDGQYSGSLACTSAQPQTFTVTPQPGSIVDVVSGTRIRLTAASAITGDTVEGLTGDEVAATEPVKPLVIVYGDSIACGFGTDVPTRDAWTILLRSRYEVGVEAWGARQLTLDYTAGLGNLLGYFASYGAPSVMWTAIGVNDFFASVPVAQFQAEYAALLDGEHSLFPNARLYAQSPLLWGSEAPNAGGSTLSQFRSAISNVCAARAFCHFVDGTAILGPSDFNPTDVVHPTTAGNAKYEAYVLTVIP